MSYTYFNTVTSASVAFSHLSEVVFQCARRWFPILHATCLHTIRIQKLTFVTTVQAFWLFKGMMRTLRPNFQEGMVAMRGQMGELKSLLRRCDPGLAKHLNLLGVGEFEVAFQV